MNQTADLHAPEQKLDNPPKHEITLTTSVNGNVISITGSGNFSVPSGQAATHCKFTLNDTSNANVKFASLDAADGTTVCPPPSGNNSSQIVGVTMNNNASPKTAQFTDNNSNQGTLSISYQWNFTCDAPYTVNPFDPVITNGGKSF
jgi:hypothetical protein